MYVPEKRIIRSGYADVKFNPPDVDPEGWKEIVRNYQARIDKEYKETSDLYDLQSEQANDLNQALKGTEGKDYLYLQQSIVDARDRLKSLYKGKKLKDTRSPQFQGELYNINQDLANKRNAIDTFHSQIKEADDYAQKAPHIKRGEWNGYVNQQMQLPPDKRDTNPYKKLTTDPLFFNPYDYAASVVKAMGETEEQLEVEKEDTILNYDAKYYPDLGKFDKDGKFIIEPSEQLIDRLFNSNPHFLTSMAGMLPPEKSKDILDNGNTAMYADDLRKQAKAYLQTVHGLSPDLKQTGKTIKSWKYDKPTSADVKSKKESEAIDALQGRLKNGDPRSLDEFIGDFWRRFDYDVNENGETIKVNATYQKEHPHLKGKMLEYTETIEVDPKDKGSVKQVLDRIRSFSNKDKKTVTPIPLQKPQQKEKGWADDL